MRLPDTPELVARLRRERWAPPLLGALGGIHGVHLVGGAVRDLLLDRSPLDLDLVVEGDAPAVAEELARRLEGRRIVHARFGTATVRSDALTFDMVTARAERYPEPGALPEVRADLLALASCALDIPPAKLHARLDALALTAGERGIVLAAATGARR